MSRPRKLLPEVLLPTRKMQRDELRHALWLLLTCDDLTPEGVTFVRKACGHTTHALAQQLGALHDDVCAWETRGSAGLPYNTPAFTYLLAMVVRRLWEGGWIPDEMLRETR